MKYKLTADGVKDLETGACIPFAEGNRHFRKYMEWCAEGNSPEPEFTAEELAAKEAADLIAAAHDDLAHTDWALLKLFIRLYQVLAGKGMVSKADMGDAYIDGALALKAKLDLIEGS